MMVWCRIYTSACESESVLPCPPPFTYIQQTYVLSKLCTCWLFFLTEEIPAYQVSLAVSSQYYNTAILQYCCTYRVDYIGCACSNSVPWNLVRGHKQQTRLKSVSMDGSKYQVYLVHHTAIFVFVVGDRRKKQNPQS